MLSCQSKSLVHRGTEAPGVRASARAAPEANIHTLYPHVYSTEASFNRESLGTKALLVCFDEVFAILLALGHYAFISWSLRLRTRATDLLTRFP